MVSSCKTVVLPTSDAVLLYLLLKAQMQSFLLRLLREYINHLRFFVRLLCSDFFLCFSRYPLIVNVLIFLLYLSS